MEQQRAIIYAFLSRVTAGLIDERFLGELKRNKELVSLLGEESVQWLETNDNKEILEALNGDYSSLFIVNSHPVESAVTDAKNDILIGLENPIVHFYFTHGYELNLNFTEILSPDHIAIELGFMENIVRSGDKNTQKEFMSQFLIQWAPLYLLGLKNHATTPFYREFFDFAVEFLVSDYAYLLDDNA